LVFVVIIIKAKKEGAIECPSFTLYHISG